MGFQQPVPPSEDRRAQVLAAAVEEFARYGYRAASTNRIARRAQVAKGLLFHYFGNKEGLYRAALAEAWPAVFGPGGKPLPEDPFDRLKAVVLERLSRLGNAPFHARLITDAVARRRALSPSLRSTVQRAYQAFRAAFKEGASTACFRPEVPAERGLDLLALVAEGLERRYVQTLALPGHGDSDLLGTMALEIDGYLDLLRRGIYRPAYRGKVIGGRTPTPSGLAPRPGSPAPGEAGDHRRHRILQAALELFAAQGYDGTTADAIAARAGVAKGLIFHHFGTKAGLYVATVRRASEQIITCFFQDATPPAADLFQRMSDVSRRKLQVFREHADLYRVVLDAVTRPPEAARSMLDQYVRQETAANWAVVLEGVDTTPFRPEVPPTRALELVMLVLDTLGDRQLEELAGKKEHGLQDLEERLDEANAYLALLRDGLCP